MLEAFRRQIYQIILLLSCDIRRGTIYNRQTFIFQDASEYFTDFTIHNCTGMFSNIHMKKLTELRDSLNALSQLDISFFLIHAAQLNFHHNCVYIIQNEEWQLLGMFMTVFFLIYFQSMERHEYWHINYSLHSFHPDLHSSRFLHWKGQFGSATRISLYEWVCRHPGMVYFVKITELKGKVGNLMTPSQRNISYRNNYVFPIVQEWVL